MDKTFVSRFLKGSVSASTGTIATVVFHFLSITVMTRAVSQETLGLYFLILATAMFFKILSNLGLDLTLVKFLSNRDQTETKEAISSIIISRLGVLAVISLAVYLGGDFILPLLGEGMEPFILFIPYIFMGHSIRELFLHLMQGLQQFKNYALVQVVSAILKFSLIFIFLRRLDLPTLLYIELAMLGASILLQIWMIPFRRLGMAWQNFNRTTLKRTLTFGMPLYYTSILTIGYSKSSVFLINYFLDPLSIALYEVALKVPEGVSRIFRSFITVYFPSISTLFSEGKKREAVKVMNKSLSYFAIICTLMCLGSFLFRHEIVTLLFSAQYSSVALAFSMLMVGVYLRVTANTLGYSLVSAGYPSTSSKVNTISVVVFLGSSLFLIPSIGYIGAVFSTIIMNTSAIICYYLYLVRAKIAPNPLGFIRPTIIGVGVCALSFTVAEPTFWMKSLFFMLGVGLTAGFVPDFRETIRYALHYGQKLARRTGGSVKAHAMSDSKPSCDEEADKKLKVLMVDSLGGNDYAFELCQGLSQAEVKIRLVTLSDRKFAKQPSFAVLPYSPSKKDSISPLKKVGQYLTYLWRVLRLAQREKTDVVHFQFFRRERIEPFFLLLLRLLNIKVVYTAHNIVPHEHNKIDYWLKGLAYRASHQIIIHSQFTERKLLRTFPFTQGKTAVVPHGNFDTYLPETPLPEAAARQHFGLNQEDQVLLFFGYLREYKGVDMLIEAFAQSGRLNHNLHLIIAGRPHAKALTQKLHRLIETHPYRGRITLHDHFIPNEDVAAYFTAADVVVLPYRHIDHSGIVHLAYSFGRPIIATSVGDFPEAVEHQKSGYVLPKNDVDCLAEMIIEATSQPEKLDQMGAYGRHLSESKYSWVDIAQKSTAVYRKTQMS